MADMETDAPAGFYCSTSGTYFSDKQSLSEHYKSDFHKYNLKRKVAGLPPVTQEWFDARKEQLASSASAGPVQKVWADPLTKKRFNTENTYQAHVRSGKYKELLKKAGLQEPPAPVVTIRRAVTGSAPQTPQQPQAAPGYKVMPVKGIQRLASTQAEQGSADEGADMANDDSDGWETASDEEGVALAMDPATASVSSASASAVPGSAAEAASRAAASSAEQSQQEQQWEEWDVRRSLFDNFMSASMEANLEYMYKKYGFYFPDAEYLVDPEGLLKYLGLKLQYGHVPLYVRGDDTNAKQFASLHAVQRHMVDANRCKMVFEDNEEEYEDFYDWSKLLEGEEGKELVVADVDDVGNGFELAVGGTEGRPVKFLGSREFARYYRQRPRLDDGRDSVSANRILSKYRALGIATAQPEDVEIKRARKQQKRHERLKYKNELKANVIRNLPKNVTF